MVTNTNGTTSNNSYAPPPDFDDGAYSGTLVDLSADEVDILYVHGWVLWAAWGVMGFLQLASFRYMRKFSPRIMLWVHSINGVAMTVMTIVMSLYAFEFYDWEVQQGFHSIIGFVILVATCAISLGGIITLIAVLWFKSSKI